MNCAKNMKEREGRGRDEKSEGRKKEQGKG
jgi:hypothetical protein